MTQHAVTKEKPGNDLFDCLMTRRPSNEKKKGRTAPGRLTFSPEIDGVREMSHLVYSPLWLLLGARPFSISAVIGEASGGGLQIN